MGFTHGSEVFECFWGKISFAGLGFRVQGFTIRSTKDSLVQTRCDRIGPCHLHGFTKVESQEDSYKHWVRIEGSSCVGIEA